MFRDLFFWSFSLLETQSHRIKRIVLLSSCDSISQQQLTQALAYNFFHSLKFAQSPRRPDLVNCVWTFAILQSCHPSRSRQPAELLTCVCQRTTEIKSSQGDAQYDWNFPLPAGCSDTCASFHNVSNF